MVNSSGKLTATKQDALGDARGTVTMASNTKLELNNTALQSYTVANKLTGNGELLKTGNGAIKLSNTANDNTGNTTVNDGNLIATASGVLSSSEITVNKSASQNGTLTLNYASLTNTVKGNGTLAVDLANSSDNFTFNSAGLVNRFTGTVDMQKGHINLGNSVQATTNATINNLTFNGGTLAFTSTSIAPDGMLTVNALDASAGGKVDVAFTGINTTVSPALNWYDYADSDNAMQHQLVSANAITGEGNIEWAGMTDDAAIKTQESLDSGVRAGEATFDYVATAGTLNGNKGLFLGYTLTELSADNGKQIILDSSSATGTNMLAKLTGDGGFTFVGTGQTATVSNSNNNYKGATVVDDTAVKFGSNNAFGATSSLTLTNAATVDMNGKTQTVGDLVSADSLTTINLGELTVNQTSNSTFAGLLAGNKLTKSGDGTLTLANTNNTYSSGTTITGGKLIATAEDALDTGTIVNNASLELSFTMDGSDSFTIQGAPLDRDSFGAKLEAGVQITPAVNLKAGYQGRFGNNSSYNGGFISMDIGF